jgi:glycine/D-amino acid oxidase-like deaminating enzyme/nitrite reductase/ring-hydroxylating ferredoxin subunit
VVFFIQKARLYAEAGRRAAEEYRRLITEKNIPCGFSQAPAFLYSLEEKNALEQEREAAEALGIRARLCADTELPFPVAAALCLEDQAMFHPLSFLKAAAEPLRVYEETRVQAVKGRKVVTDRGTVMADHVVFACHYPFLNFPGYYFMRMHQERSYVLALKNAAHIRGMYLGVDKGGLSFRPHGEMLLIGGGSHRTGENSAGGKYRQLQEAAGQYWPQSREAARWSAQDCMTLDGIPYIGRFASSTPHWYAATGFQKWGMTSSMVSALLIRDLIVKGKSPWEEVFTPQRFSPSASAGTLFQETAQAARGLSRRWLAPPPAAVEALPNGRGGIVDCDGEKLGVYKDENGACFAVSAHCPHLGCQLKWNPDEKSWDCPCHGSRFSFRGELLDGPAQKELPHG